MNVDACELKQGALPAAAAMQPFYSYNKNKKW
jgi:hypothetical protein